MKVFPNALTLNRLICAVTAIIILTIGNSAKATDDITYVAFTNKEGSFPLSERGKSSSIYASETDFQGVKHTLKNFQTDIQSVTKAKPNILHTGTPKEKNVVLVGTIGKNSLIDKLIAQKRIDVSGIKGKWETHLIQVIENPFPGVEKALVILGSDKRGTIYGIYDLSAQIGVSPWYYWADVPVKEHSAIYVLPGKHSKGEPKVKFRGIFINDEAPALSGWSKEKFGGFNHKFYEKVFELILRLKGNYLWPAMWGSAFYDDDPLNAKLANEYGIVIGTSHHEPMMRAHDEWRRVSGGAWNYNTNAEKLKDFWRQGIKRMGENESVVTVGMRGDGDEPMTEGSNIALLEKIVKDQREIIKEVTGKNPEETPQLWALYKEVQDYYDKGMRVPEDVTLLLCDDNWGNIRKLPKLNEAPRKGGYGIYYHYDYVGGPRNYKWLNTNPITKVWEQMHLAYQYKVDRLWLVNVGDIKPMEFPIEFFLDYAWDPDKWPVERLGEYTRLWASREFGTKYAQEIANIISKYTKYNSRRKPELLSPETYSITNYAEAERVLAEWQDIEDKAEKIYSSLPKAYKDAFFQLVLHPVKACSNLNLLYITVAKNRQSAKQGRANTNELADLAEGLFAKDAEISRYYNLEMANGKWNHMMDQTHIGYTYWQQPEKNAMPEVQRIQIPSDAQIGVAIEGSDEWWPESKKEAILPDFTEQLNQKYYIDIFNKGSKSFNYVIKTESPWLIINSRNGKVEKEERVWISIDWKKVPEGVHDVPVHISGPNDKTISVTARLVKPTVSSVNFLANDGYISVEALHYTNAIGDRIKWKTLPDYGRTLSGITPFPVTSPRQQIASESPRLEYEVFVPEAKEIELHTYVSPTIDFKNTDGLKFAVSFDDEEPQIQTLNLDKSQKDWNKAVADNIWILRSKHFIKNPGRHTLKFWMIDPGVVTQKFVIDLGGLKPSYLGPPETAMKK